VVATAEGRALVKLSELSIPGLVLLESPVWSDERGFFREWYKQSDFEASGLEFRSQQANLSISSRNVVRGLHYSLAPQGQAKVVTCVFGDLDDVIVDVRIGSPAFGRVEVVHLAANDVRSLLLPAGVAHGFCVTSEHAALSYMLSSPFNGPLELEINPFDTQIAVPWTIEGDAIVSPKDLAAPSLAERAAANQLPIFV
jgi:dTDP-4-dehydrorhamnose 3,5-epimerase